MLWPGFEPASVRELHHFEGPFKGRSTNWATATAEKNSGILISDSFFSKRISSSRRKTESESKHFNLRHSSCRRLVNIHDFFDLPLRPFDSINPIEFSQKIASDKNLRQQLRRRKWCFRRQQSQLQQWQCVQHQRQRQWRQRQSRQRRQRQWQQRQQRQWRQ